MHNKQEEQQHPGVNFILLSFSASIKESSLEGDNYFVIIDSQSTANNLKLFLTEKKISFDHEDMQFLIDLTSIPENLVKPSKVQPTGTTKLEKLMDAIRSQGAVPVPFSSRALLRGQVRVNTTTGDKRRLDFFDESQASVLVPCLREMGFIIEKGGCEDIRCFIVDLNKSSIDKEDIIKVKTSRNQEFKNSISSKSALLAWLKIIGISDSEITSKGTQKKTGFNYRLLSIYFKTSETRDFIFKKMKADFPSLFLLTTGYKGILIAHKGSVLETEIKETQTEQPKTQIAAGSGNSLKKTLLPKELKTIMKELAIVSSNISYMEKGTLENLSFDARGIFFKKESDQQKLFEFLKKEFPKVKIAKIGKSVLVKANRKIFSRNLKPGNVSNQEAGVKKTIRHVREIKTTEKTEPISVFTKELKDLLEHHGMLPKVEQPAGVLIPDSIGHEIVLPHDALIKTGADGITISTKALREFFKK